MNVPSPATALRPARCAPDAPATQPARPPLRPSSRETILDAAEAVAQAAGAVHLTLDAVAERAGVSKGGLLYNFPTKEALLQAMVDRNMCRLAQDHAAALAQLPPGPGRELKAFVHTAARKSACSEKRLGGSLLAASANNPRLLEPVHRFHRWRLEMIDAAAREGLPFERAAVASLALDGICLLEMLGLSPFSADQRARILDDLLHLIDEISAGQSPGPTCLKTTLPLAAMETIQSRSPARDVKSAGDLPPSVPVGPRQRTRGAWWGRFLLTLIAVVAVIAVVAGVKVKAIMGMIAAAKAGKFDPPPTAVTTAVIHGVRWQPTLHAIGSLEAVQGVTVSADLPGVVKEIRFESGATVRQGDILIRLVIDQEQAQLDAATAQRDISVLNLTRQRDLRAKNANSQSDFDTAEANERQMEAMVANARAAIDRKTIRAPFAGRLGIRRASLGQYLNSGDPVVALQSLDPIYVNFTLPQQNLRDFGVGADVEVRTDATGDTVFKGKVNAINSLVDSTTRNFQAQATLANPDGKLRPGMFANVDVLLGGEKDVLPVPGSAIAYAPYGNSVYVIVHDIKVPPADPTDPTQHEKIVKLAVNQRFIKTGQTKGDLVAVTSGLKEGDEIVTSGVFKLQNNGAVQINNSVKPEAEANPKPEES